MLSFTTYQFTVQYFYGNFNKKHIKSKLYIYCHWIYIYSPFTKYIVLRKYASDYIILTHDTLLEIRILNPWSLTKQWRNNCPRTRRNHLLDGCNVLPGDWRTFLRAHLQACDVEKVPINPDVQTSLTSLVTGWLPCAKNGTCWTSSTPTVPCA